MERRRPAVVLAIVNAVMLVGGFVAALARRGPDPAEAAVTATSSDAALAADVAASSAPARASAPPPPARKVTAAEVLARPEPPRVTPTGRWSATLEGTGERVRVYAPAVVTSRGSTVTADLGSVDPRPRPQPDGTTAYGAGTALAMPDGNRWYPLGPVRLSGVDRVALLSAGVSGDAVGGSVTWTELGRLLGKGGVEATGRFAQRDGREATSLRLPAGTRLSGDCAAATRSAPPTPCDPGANSSSVTVQGGSGLRLEVDVAAGQGGYGNGEGGVEIEIAGSVVVAGAGGRWGGLAGSLEANDLRATVTRTGAGWSVSASARSARQLWVDVWPVVNTVLQVRSGYDGGIHSCAGDCSVRLRYANVGFATAQIFEAEAIGGTNAVDLGIKQTGTHDAGLGVHRGGREINLGSGRGIDSHMPPGAREDRGLTFTPGVPTTLVLRGNFPETRVALAIPSARRAA